MKCRLMHVNALGPGSEEVSVATMALLIVLVTDRISDRVSRTI